ncbi:mediator of RNA polymerase II transcription subunit 12 [Aspergillus campestris IBT 28561]|uniref:Mediator of RNA polymerase II transcription subunit 12 n=1 Tax=Aspergillus campestris (strain IBT 28561) TaxID=1392248 RepID=A0A2I1DD28_ASPC2|nr:mediator of RNA polymerase II transcription subunit 12 [Aspergillus campestris IBT 28561]PKY07776.1 mediator of RNA polymerase II transcription subunit 12 [Aspergillus campestris IBT 28561]
MIPHPTAGVPSWGPPPRAYNPSGARRPPDLSHPQSEMSTSMPQPLPRQPAVIDLTANVGDTQEREPPAKRPRLDLPVAASSVGDRSPFPGSAGEARITPGVGSAKPPSFALRGRPVWSFQALVSEAPGAGDAREGDAAAVAQRGKRAEPPPFPVLPWQGPPPSSLESAGAKSRDSSPSTVVQTTPYHIEVPPSAPVLKGDRIADFSPWTGNHPEDVLNEQTAKQGHYDRTQVSQNESNTARPSLYAQLKHRSGLHMLSAVFTAALEKRQNHNTVANPSTFKPPPRVTLTDNKREVWLRDLANSSVPLRRLSRTIPHGIRGKVLLDQCLSKWIPVSRAVWLAKCVGANEIRAFKRKGTSGTLAVGLEAKWVRDWTATVQQFLEGVVAACGSADWRRKMTYAVSLTARLFFERLLDHDQYLGWFLTSLEVAPLNTVPAWLLMLGIYWDSILRYRKRARRLTESLLAKLHPISELDRTAPLRPLADRLSFFVKRLILEHTSSVVLLDSWDKYKDLISSCLDFNDNVHKAVFQTLAERNLRIQSPKSQHGLGQQSSQQRLIHLLDSINATHDISATSAACLDAIDDRGVVVSKLLEWTATSFRYGICRVYTAVRLLRKWKASGVDIDSHILDFLNGDRDSDSLNMGNIYHVISELVRSQTFSVGRYLQWLMAKGVAADHSEPGQPQQSEALGLLLQLPTGRLPEHVRNLRNTLLTRAGISASQEESTIASLKASVAEQLPDVFEAQMLGVTMADMSPNDLTWAVKSEIGQWMRRGVTGYARESHRKIPGASWASEARVCALNPDQFYRVRSILESFEDLSMLADVLKQASNSEDSVVLASAADTVSYHFSSLSAIGAVADLFKGLVESYSCLKRLGPPNLDLVFSLIELGLQMPHEHNTVALLRQDLCRIENRSALTAPSPLSDHAPLAFNPMDSALQEKLDQLLGPNGGIDESTMDTIFSSLTKILGSVDGQPRLSANDACRYLAQLRLFRPKHFDGMLVRWICSLLRSPTRPALSQILPPLIGVGCVTIQAFVFLVKRILQSEKVATAFPNLADLRIDLLELLIPSDSFEPNSHPDLVTYRFHLAQREFIAKHPRETFDIVRDAISLINSHHGQVNPRRADLTSCAMSLVHILLTQDPERAVKYCMEKFVDHPSSTGVLQQALDHLLGFDSEPDRPAEKVVEMNDDFSLPFCQLKLQMMFNAEPGNSANNGIVDSMFSAAVADSRANRSHWVGLVSLMSLDAVRQIRERAEKAFFAIPMFEEPAHDSTTDRTSSPDIAKLYLTIIEKLAFSVPETGVPFVAPIIVEKMDLLLHRLVVMQNNFLSSAANKQGSASEQMARARANFERTLAFWFSALLKIVVIHRNSFVPSSLTARPTIIQEQSRLLISIFCISLARLPDNVLRLFPAADYFPHPVLSEKDRPCPGILLQTHALDVAASLIDMFPDEARQGCARFLKEKCPPFIQVQANPRVPYLLGPVPDVAANAPQPASLSSPSPVASGSTPTPIPSNSFTPGPAAPQHQIPAASIPPGLSEGANYIAGQLRLQYRGRVVGPYPVRPWELLEDAAPIVGVNDTAINLKHFDARRVRA